MNIDSSLPHPAPVGSLHSFIGRLAADTRSTAVVVSDDDGLVIDGFGGAEHQAALAAWSSTARSAPDQAALALEDSGIDGPVYAVPVDLEVTRVHLVCFGGRAPSSQRAADTLHRVLS